MFFFVEVVTWIFKSLDLWVEDGDFHVFFGDFSVKVNLKFRDSFLELNLSGSLGSGLFSELGFVVGDRLLQLTVSGHFGVEDVLEFVQLALQFMDLRLVLGAAQRSDHLFLNDMAWSSLDLSAGVLFNFTQFLIQVFG